MQEKSDLSDIGRYGILKAQQIGKIGRLWFNAKKIAPAPFGPETIHLEKH